VNAWLVLLIAVAAVVTSFWLAAEFDRWRRQRRHEAGLRRVYEEGHADVDENAGVDRLRDRRLW
jgi:hypothetical protein